MRKLWLVCKMSRFLRTIVAILLIAFFTGLLHWWVYGVVFKDAVFAFVLAVMAFILFWFDEWRGS